MLAVAGVGYWVWKHGSALECVDRVVEQYPSSDKSKLVVRYERNCGGAIATHLALRLPQDSNVDRADDLYVASGRPALAINWTRSGAVLVGAQSPSAIAPRSLWRDTKIGLFVTGYGPRCSSDSQCEKGRSCLRHGGYDWGGTQGHFLTHQGTCEVTCDRTAGRANCPAGYSCGLISDAGPQNPNGAVCLLRDGQFGGPF
jgi:hypothetical protein